ncbi:MAG TPA: PQQ-binding-like beta-propeller repeat protein [Acidimicrobiales bacterium]|nr:PQQ-binding-like beta-propeller repeat protein [Acidimicrobiales bacterium]
MLAPVVALSVLSLAAGACGAGPSASPGAGRTSIAVATTGTSNAAGTTAPGTGASTTPAPAAGWLTYGGSFARASVDTTGPTFVHAPTAAWTSPPLDGPVYGEPLLDAGLVLVATQNDTVYALSAADGTISWSDHLATAVPAGMLPCGDIAPSVGVTSTMVIDPGTGTLFASAALVSGGAVRHAVYAIDIATHRVSWSRDVDQPGWSAAAELQRAALALSAGRVIVGFGGNYGDCGEYHGWVLGVPESGTGPLLAYRVPTNREGAVWAAAGVSVDAAGDVYAVTGNGDAGPGTAFDHGNSVIELTPRLTERQYFAPADWAQDNAGDADLGSTAAILLDGSRLFVVGKQHTAYLLDATALGGVGHPLASVVVCESRGGNAYRAPDAYVVCPDDGTIAQVRVGPRSSLSRGWTWSSPTGGAGSPTIAGGVLWTVDLDASLLYGVDLSSGTTRFRLRLDTGTPAHFAAPGAAGGLLVVAGARAVEAFR